MYGNIKDKLFFRKINIATYRLSLDEKSKRAERTTLAFGVKPC
jgi:hypothetical protein